jgi:hypothetical protein
MKHVERHLYVLKQGAVDRHRKALDARRVGRGCIRFRKANQIDFTTISALLRDTAKSKAATC